MKNLIIVGSGGMVGTMLRYLLYISFPAGNFPYVTMGINITGSFIIGLIAGYAIRQPLFADWRLFLATGICGGFTTFSAFSIETVELLRQSRNIAALVYIISSVVFGLAAAFAGYVITK